MFTYPDLPIENGDVSIYFGSLYVQSCIQWRAYNYVPTIIATFHYTIDITQPALSLMETQQ